MLLLLWGSNYIEFITRIRNTTMICSSNNRINETMTKNVQSFKKQNVNSVQYKTSRDHPTNEAQGELKSNGKLHESPGGLSESSPLRSDGSCDGQVGRLESKSGGQKQLKGATRLETTQIRQFS
jgi:hypothetical protein